jgi:hypothetical protein
LEAAVKKVTLAEIQSNLSSSEGEILSKRFRPSPEIYLESSSLKKSNISTNENKQGLDMDSEDSDTPPLPLLTMKHGVISEVGYVCNRQP